ncbi:hypothetical protein PENTCL1PPCAC_14327, partial [Pristionchus entomophagus]
AYSYTTSTICCVSNVLLIYVLAVTQLTHVGPYRYLLLTFAVVDILVSLVHLLNIPATHMTEFGYIFFSYRFLHDSTAASVWASLSWVALFYQTFVLLAFHFVYRYVIMCSPGWLAWIQRRPWRNWLIIALGADVIFVGGILLTCLFSWTPNEFTRNVYAPILKEAYDIDLLGPNKPGYLGIVYWVLNEKGEKEWIMFSLLIIGWIIILFFSNAALIIFCTFKIIWELNESKVRNLAPATKRLQKQLFTTLLVQTIVPCLTSYTPMAMLFLVPLTGIGLGGIGTVLIMSTALFPMLDPYIVIFLISG